MHGLKVTLIFLFGTILAIRNSLNFDNGPIRTSERVRGVKESKIQLTPWIGQFILAITFVKRILKQFSCLLNFNI